MPNELNIELNDKNSIFNILDGQFHSKASKLGTLECGLWQDANRGTATSSGWSEEI